VTQPGTPFHKGKGWCDLCVSHKAKGLAFYAKKEEAETTQVGLLRCFSIKEISGKQPHAVTVELYYSPSIDKTYGFMIQIVK